MRVGQLLTQVGDSKATITDVDVSLTCGDCGKQQTLGQATVREKGNDTAYYCSCGSEVAGVEVDGSGGAQLRTPFGFEARVGPRNLN